MKKILEKRGKVCKAQVYIEPVVKDKRQKKGKK